MDTRGYGTQSRQSASRLFLQSSDLGLPHPLIRGRVCPLPLWFRGGHTLLLERGWEGPNSDEGTDTVVLKVYICPFGSGGGHTCLRERGGGGPDSDEGTDTVVLYSYCIYVLFDMEQAYFIKIAHPFLSLILASPPVLANLGKAYIEKKRKKVVKKTEVYGETVKVYGKKGRKVSRTVSLWRRVREIKMAKNCL
jgi:hypothetical protein